MLFRKLPVLVQQLKDMHAQYGDVFRFYVGPKLFVVVTQPEDVKAVLVGCSQRQRDPYFMRPTRFFIGDGLVTNKDDVWKAHRKIVLPTFHTEVLGRFMGVFNEAGRFVCERLSAEEGTELNVYPTFFQSALRTLTSTLFGVGLDQLEPDHSKQVHFATEFYKSMKAIQRIVFRPWLQVVCMVSTALGARWLREREGQIHRLVARGIAYKRQHPGGDREPANRRPLAEVLIAPHGQLLLSPQEVHDEVCTSHVCQLGPVPSAHQLQGDSASAVLAFRRSATARSRLVLGAYTVCTFAMAGTETTASTLGFALSLLGLHPEWQDVAQKELDAVFGNGDDYLRPCTMEDLTQLTVIDSIVKETLRLFSVVPTLPHYASEDIQLAGGRYTASRGSCVLLALCLLQRQPHLFPDPDKFDPGRFLEGGSAHSRLPYSYVPFGAGSRMCVGARFAQLEIKTVLASVLRRFHILPGSSREELEEVALAVTGLPLSGLRVSCVPRNNLPVRLT
ncbi:cytochrome P450 4g15-like [Schistocerca serialis cubense]|uniref:cytochrome P450 4g15-like n=1 Tax=Schistocerca serialis cubense TaxID=2023355 RepID=UPI00214F4D30|nr:cytochrome P450 4g15-like [Schistocerca serialis cubense]